MPGKPAGIERACTPFPSRRPLPLFYRLFLQPLHATSPSTCIPNHAHRGAFIQVQVQVEVEGSVLVLVLATLTSSSTLSGAGSGSD